MPSGGDVARRRGERGRTGRTLPQAMRGIEVPSLSLIEGIAMVAAECEEEEEEEEELAPAVG